MKKIVDNIYVSDRFSERTSSRNSNIEFLRVLSMLMIVAYHYSIYGFYSENIMYTHNKFFVDIFGMGGKIGTDLFVLISGYYMVNSSFTIKKLLSLMGQLWFYSIGALITFSLIYGSDILSFELLKLSFFPLLSGHYWFVSYYVILLVLSPFLNILVKNLSRKQHLLLCVILFTLCTVMPEFLHLSYADGSLPLFVALYVSAAFLRLHIADGEKNKFFSLAALVLLVVFCLLRIISVDVLGQIKMDSALLEASTAFMGAYSPFAFLIAVAMLLLFASMKARHNGFLSFIGGTALGVYLFHDNVLVREVLWQNILHTSSFSESQVLFLHAIVSVLFVFCAGVFLELIRQQSVEKLWNKFCACTIAKFG